MKKTMIKEMREEWSEFFEKYHDAVLVEQYEYCLPVQDCYIPAFVEFPIKVTFKDGSVKYFETTFGGIALRCSFVKPSFPSGTCRGGGGGRGISRERLFAAASQCKRIAVCL